VKSQQRHTGERRESPLHKFQGKGERARREERGDEDKGSPERKGRKELPCSSLKRRSTAGM